MTKVADFFQPLPDALSLVPTLRETKSLLDAGWTARLRINYWSGFAFGHNEPQLTVQFEKIDQDPLTIQSNWADFINEGLIQLKVRAADELQESDRFSLSLDTAFTPAEQVAGDGFFNSVLFDFIRQSELGEEQVISGLLLQVKSVVTLDQGTLKYFHCKQLIDVAIRGRALELKDDLGYSMDEAWKILVEAVARYLDRRFSVTIRQQRGLL